MGMLTKVAKNSNLEKNVTDDTLLALSMGCMAFADGVMDNEEIATVEAFATTLPEFKDGCFGRVWNDSAKIYMKHDGDLTKIVPELGKLSTPELKQKAFILAADVALASGDVDEAEDELLETMARILEIDEQFAAKAIEVLAAKYA